MKKCLGRRCCLLAVLFLAGMLCGCSEDTLSKDVSAIKSRLEKIEERLSNIEKSSQKMAFLEKEFQKVQQSMEAWERAITARFAPVSDKKSRSSNKAVKAPKESKFYVVERGDSLFRIAQKHGMTLDRLCQLNKITAKTVLHPGTKLLVN